jgi:hypothetical protein
MEKVKSAIVYFEDAVRESDEIISEASDDLKKELTEQKEHFVVALAALIKQVPMMAKPLKRIPGICKCPVCRIDLCTKDGKTTIYCPDCGQAVIV